jgi:AcrR family transcriptional regulator
MMDSFQTKTTRDAILDATDRLLARHGYKKMTIDDLAREVGIGKGSVYLHFTSKEEIALSHIDRIVERTKRRLELIAKRKLSCEKRLVEMLCDRVLFRFDSVQHYTQSLNELLAQLRPKLLERRKRHFEEEARILAAVIDEGIMAGVFSKRDPLESARTLLLGTNSLLPYSLSTQELGERKEIEARLRRLSQILVNGLSHP